jgi:SOS response regulatory protein OraA/RecX
MRNKKIFGIGIFIFSLFALVLILKTAAAYPVYNESQTISFTASYRNSTTPFEPINTTFGNCTIAFSDTPTIIRNMTYNSTSQLYLYNKSFAINGTYKYNISCFSIIFDPTELINYVYIQVEDLPTPQLWPLSNQFTNQNPYNIIGYTNQINVTVNVYRNDSETRNYDYISGNITLYGSSLVKSDAGAGTSKIYVSDGLINSLFKIGRFVIFEGHNRTYFLGYNITNVNSTPDPLSDYIIIEPALEDNVVIDEVIWIRNSVYPSGWFNLTLTLLPGYNNILSSYLQERLVNTENDEFGIVTVLYNLSSANSEQISLILESQPPEINLSSIPSIINTLNPTIRFNITDDYKINITSLLINASNGTSVLYYAYNPTAFGIIGNFGSNINCTGTDTLKNCYVQLNLSEGNYNLTFWINDSVGNQNITILNNITVDASISPITGVSDTGLTTTGNLYFNWTPIQDTSGINHYEYSLWVYYYNASTTRVNVTGWNATNATNVTISRSFVIDGKYFLEVRAVDNAENIGNSASSDGIFFVDVSAPTCDNCVHDIGSWTNNLTLFGWWNFSEPESNIIDYTYRIGNNTCFLPGYDSIRNETHTSLTNATYIATSLQNNITYYFNVIARNNEQIRNSTSNCYSSNGVRFDNIPPSNGSIYYPGGNLSVSNIIISLNKGMDNLSNLSRAEVYQSKTPINNLTGSCGNYVPALLNSTIGLDDQEFIVTTEDGYCYKFWYRVYDRAGNYVEYSSSNQGINDSKVDSTPPSGVLVTDEGTMTTSRQLRAEWTYASDPESGIAYYEYTIGTAPGEDDLLGTWRTTTQNDATEYGLNMDDSMTYYFTVRAFNHIGTPAVESFSDGITFFDRSSPLPVTILSVGNDNVSSDGYYDNISSTNTTILISGEASMTCVYSLYDISYTDYPDNNQLTAGQCGATVGDLANCTIIVAQGNWTYYIMCKDQYGNQQDDNHNTKVTFIKDFSVPTIAINEPTDAIRVGGLVRINATISEASPLNYSRYVIYNNTDESQFIQQQITNGTLSNGFATWDSTSFDNITNLTLAVQVMDIMGYYNSTHVNFTLDNTVPYITLDAPGYVKQNFTINFTISLFTNFTYNITYAGTVKQFNSTTSDQASVVYFLQNITLDDDVYWPDGLYNITAYAIRNNSNNVTFESSFTIDRVLPYFRNLTILPDLIHINKNVSLGVLISENSSLNFVKLQVNTTDTILNYTVSDLITYISGTYYFMNTTNNLTIGGKTINLIKTGSSSAIITVDEVQEVISVGSTKTVNGLSIKVKEVFNEDGSIGDSAVIQIKLPVSFYDGIHALITLNSSTLSNNKTYFYRWVANDSAGNYNYTEWFNFSVINRGLQFSDSMIFDFWPVFGSSESYTFNLTSYIYDEDNDNLTISYLVGDSNISVSINSTTKIATITSLNNWDGYSWIIFNASDPYGESNVSENISLYVYPTRNIKIKISSVENISVNYMNLSNNILNSTYANSSFNFTVDGFNYNLHLLYNKTKISLFLSNINPNTTLNFTINTSKINLSNISNSGLSLGDPYRYIVRDAYVFMISSNYTDETAVIFNYTGINVTSTSKLVIFRIEYDSFSINYSNYALYNNLIIDTLNNISWTYVNTTSLFVLAEDRAVTEICSNSIDDDYDGETDEGCTSPSGSSGGSSGGGSGSLSGNRIVKPNCTDGLQNQKETGIDCGGPCEACIVPLPGAKPSCSDALQNQNEEGVDCGGPCLPCAIPELPLETPTCYDFIQNQNEEGVDCGGPCEACIVIEEEKPFSFAWLGWLIGLIFLIPLLVLAGLFLYKKYYKEEKPAAIAQQELETVRLKPLTETEYQSHKEEIFELPEFEIKKDTEQGQLYGYVKNLLDKGKTRMDIRRELMVEGWTEKQINKVLKQITYHQRIADLEEYINHCYANGYTKDQVRQTLIDASWSDEIVDLVIHEVHNIHDDLDKVKDYVRHRIGLGHSMDEIRETLFKIGWDHKVIEPLLDYGIYALKDEYDFDKLDE